MNVEEAYDYVQGRLQELKAAGIRVTVAMPRAVRDGGPRLDDLISRYQPPERLHHQKWRHVTLYAKTAEAADQIHLLREELRERGISFDSGCTTDIPGHDWELDWSFCVLAPVAQEERQQMHPVIAEALEEAGYPISIERNREGSRATILGYLQLVAPEWVEARKCLRNADDRPLLNVWSEDLQDLVREGLVESRHTVDRMSMKSLVRISSHNPTPGEADARNNHENAG